MVEEVLGYMDLMLPSLLSSLCLSLSLSDVLPALVHAFVIPLLTLNSHDCNMPLSPSRWIMHLLVSRNHTTPGTWEDFIRRMNPQKAQLTYWLQAPLRSIWTPNRKTAQFWNSGYTWHSILGLHLPPPSVCPISCWCSFPQPHDSWLWSLCSIQWHLTFSSVSFKFETGP